MVQRCERLPPRYQVPSIRGRRQPPPPTPAAVIATRPEGAVGPIDLGTVGTERAGDELPARGGHYIALKSAGRGRALFVCEIEEDAAVASDGSLFTGIALRAPLAEEAGALICLLRRRLGRRGAGDLGVDEERETESNC